MIERRTPIDSTTPLSVQLLRELMREARVAFVPDYVGGLLRRHAPTIVEGEAQEIAALLRGLVGAGGARLRDAGIEPLHDERAKPERLPKREREYVANVVVLAKYETQALLYAGGFDEALLTGQEALAWCRTIGDHSLASAVWRDVTIIYSARQQADQQEYGARRALAEARLSGDPMEIVSSLDFLCSYLVVRYRMEEAEALNDEALELAKMTEETKRFLPTLLLDRARIKVHQTSDVEALRICHEALRWCDGEEGLMDRSMILSFLGTTYLRLGQYNQCIASHHEVIKIGEKIGSDVARGWGYYRLAEAHFLLGEMKQAEEMLDRADECATRLIPQLSAAVAVKRIQVYESTGRYDEAARLARAIIADIDSAWYTAQVAAYRALAEIEERSGNYEEAERNLRRAIEITRIHTSVTSLATEISLAELLHTMRHDAEAEELLDGIEAPQKLPPAEHVRLLQLRAKIAEENDDLARALEYQRRAFAMERELLERRAEESLRNARVVAETERLEREADMERERRRRLEHELADAIVEISDRKKAAESMEQRLREALNNVDDGRAPATTDLLSETLSDLRSQKRQHDSPLRYLSGVDEDFYRRLRQRCPDLTPKQERLCALLRAGLASKEIASLLDLEAEGLKAQRKRLRKRLGLSADQRLEVVLAEI